MTRSGRVRVRVRGKRIAGLCAIMVTAAVAGAWPQECGATPRHPGNSATSPLAFGGTIPPPALAHALELLRSQFQVLYGSYIGGGAKTSVSFDVWLLMCGITDPWQRGIMLRWYAEARRH